MEYKEKMGESDIESNDEMMRKWADATARGGGEPEHSQKQQRGVEANPCNVDEIQHAIKQYLFRTKGWHTPPSSHFHEMTSTGTFSTSSNTALSVFDLYWVAMGMRLIDGQGAGRILTCPTCRTLKRPEGPAARALHSVELWRGVLGRCTPTPARK